jgi:hypothetical protein
MGINKDLNVDPYYDDFDESKQFNRVLFKPARAVQARELTQLQTILQKQVERFGSNVYKEGTIISGINLTTRDDINYVKLDDQVGFDDPSLFNEITDEDGRTKRYKLVGRDTGLEAEIILGLGGFETQAPNLKTFFINYLKSQIQTSDSNLDIKEFGSGEKLEIRDWNDNPVSVGGAGTTVTVNGGGAGTDHVGKSFGISCEEGVIYQKGHFIFVEKQFIIVTRYSNVAGQSATDSNIINPISVGFTIEENVVDSNQDSSLLDNASGFNNHQAPGADRLQLVPKLVSYDSDTAPDEFFTLIRFSEGNPTRVRDFTEFSTLGDELARRTYEESGNYVVEGLDSVLQKEDGQVEVNVSPGKAYIYGREVRNVANTLIDIDPVITTQSNTDQKTSFSYGQYIRVAYSGSNDSNFIDLNFDKTAAGSHQSYVLLGNSGATKIGTCNIISARPDVSTGNNELRLFVFNIVKVPVQADENLTHIALNTTNPANFDPATATKVAVIQEDGQGRIYGSNHSTLIFDTGKNGLSSISDTDLVQIRQTTATANSSGVCRIPPTIDGQPIAQSAYTIAIKDNGGGNAPTLHRVTNVTNYVPTENNDNGFNGIDVTLSGTSAEDGNTFRIIYPFSLTRDVHQDTLEEKSSRYVQSTVSGGIVQLGVANVVKLEAVYLIDGAFDQSDNSNQSDVTSDFVLVNNQKDNVYDYSYLRQKNKSPITSGSSLLVKYTHLARDNTNGNGYLTVNSYQNISTTLKQILPEYTGKDLKSYNLFESIDARPYVRDMVTPSQSLSNAQTVSSSVIDNKADLVSGGNLHLFEESQIASSTFSYFLSRIDSVVLDEYGNTLLIKGGEAESPVPPKLDRQYALADILIPGGSNEINGDNRIRIEERSNKNYTMLDIEQLEDRLDDLTDMVTLSMAERDIQSLIITDTDGTERFKNGILADTFKDLTGADFTDPEFNASIDKSKFVAQPAIKEFPLDLKIDFSNTDNVSEDFEELTTLSFNSVKKTIINQPYATNVRNCVSNYYSYQGRAFIHPKFVFHRDVIKNPVVHLQTDIASSVLNAVKNIQKFIPLTRTTRGRRRQTASWIDRVRRIRGAPTRVTNFVQNISTTKLTTKIKTQTQPLGNFITDFSMKPYLKQHVIRIAVSGLRPNTVHHFFFGGKNVDAHVRQFRYPWYRLYSRYYRRYHRNGRMRSKRHRMARYLPYRNWADWYFGRRRGRRGRYAYSTTTVRTDSRGNLLAFFRVPAGKFFVGQNKLEISDVSQYSSIESGGTSYACQTHRGYNFSISKTQINNTTRTVDFDTSTTVVKREFQRRRRDPIAQTFKMRAADTGNANFGYVSDIDVYFRRKATNQGVTLQIREAQNGYPTSTVLPEAEVYLDPSDVSVSTLGTVPTKFEFDNPIKLKADVEYCFVIIPDGNSPEYLIYTSKVGNRSLSKGNTARSVSVTNDWGDGVLFTSTNDSTWKSYQDEDLKFSINRYSFNTTGFADLVPNDVEFLTIRDNKKLTKTDGTVGPELINFEDDESVYVLKDCSFNGEVGADGDLDSPEVITVSNSQLASLTATGKGSFNVGDYIIIQEIQEDDATDAPNRVLSRIESIDNTTYADNNETAFNVDTPYYEIDGTETVSVTLVTSAKVEYYDPENPSTLHLTESSARRENYFNDNPVHGFGEFEVGTLYQIVTLGNGTPSENTLSWRSVSGNTGLQPVVGTQFTAVRSQSLEDFNNTGGTARPLTQVLIGAKTGAEATITSLDTQGISYFQPQVQVDNTPKTSSKVDLYQKVAGELVVDKPITENDDIYVTGNPRVIVSKSKQIENAPGQDGDIVDDFRFRVTLDNGGFDAVSPSLDDDMSNLNVYEFEINDSISSPDCNYISKEVILNPDMPAEGLKVLLEAYRPMGTAIEVYARFVKKNNLEEKTNWIALNNKNSFQFSSASNVEDYRTFEFDLDESGETAYYAFQIKISMRHMAPNELDNPAFSGIVPSASLFPTISSYRAVAVT